jgi:hypothetical protein
MDVPSVRESPRNAPRKCLALDELEGEIAPATTVLQVGRALDGSDLFHDT